MDQPKTELLSLLLMLTSTFGLLFVVGGQVRLIYRRHTMMNRALARLYEQSLTFIPGNLADSGLAEDPIVQKYSIELEALGCQHCGDFHAQPAAESESMFRHYVLPEERLFVSLVLLRATRTQLFFPARALLLAHSYFADGARLVSRNSDTVERAIPNSKAILYRIPNARDPASFLRRHREKVQQLLADGRQLASPMSLQMHLDSLRDAFARTSAYRQKHGYYSWCDAVRQHFVKREQPSE
jgi:hypothetical protein